MRTLRVLVADDEKWIRSLLRSMVGWDDLGMEVCGEAASGTSAFDLVERLSPDIVITDVRMPGMDGLEFITRLRTSHPRVVAVVISGYDEFEYAQRALRASVLDFLLKPLNKAQVEKVMRRAADFVAEREREHTDVRTLRESVRKLEATISGDAPRPPSAAGIDSRIARACEILNMEYAANPTLDEIAERVFVSRTYFSELFKQEVGVGFTRYVQQIRLDKAKDLLAKTPLLVAEVAQAVGFSDAAYFCRFFRKHAGMTPGAYRQSQVE